MNIKYTGCFGVCAVLLAVCLFGLLPAALAQEDPQLMATLNKIGYHQGYVSGDQNNGAANTSSQPPPPPSSVNGITGSLAHDLKSSASWAAKTVGKFVTDTKTVATFISDKVQLCKTIVEYAKIAGAAIAGDYEPALKAVCDKVYDKIIEAAKETGAEMLQLASDTFVGEYSFTSRMMHEWCNEKEQELDRARAKIQSWRDELPDVVGTTKAFFRDQGIICIDDEGQLSTYYPPDQEWNAELEKLSKGVKNEPAVSPDHQWMANEFARKKSERQKEDENKARSRDLQQQAGAGWCGPGGGGGGICP